MRFLRESRMVINSWIAIKGQSSGLHRAQDWQAAWGELKDFHNQLEVLRG